jgi:MFS family permease
MTVAMFLLGIVSGRLAIRFSSKRVLFVGAFIAVVPFVLLAYAHHHKWEVLLASALLGTGFGLAFSAMSNLIVAAVAPSQTGVASGMNANIRTIGGSIGAAVMASVVTSGVRPGALPRESGYTHGFLMLGAAALAAALAVLLIPSKGIEHHTVAEIHDEMLHAEVAIVAGATLAGDEPE